MSSVAVVGAGLGGLAAAALMAHRGLAVTVLEKNEAVGGKMGRWTERGYSFDTGPTLLTMPFVVRELFASVGRSVDDYLRMVPVEPLCRYFYPDGSRLDAFSDPDRMDAELQRFAPGDAAGFRRFLEHGRSIYDASAEPFLFSPFGSWNLRTLWKNLRHLPAVAHLDAFRTLDEAVRDHVHDRRLQQLLNRFATYNGSSPYRAPATLSLIPAVEFGMGGWYIKGGMYGLAKALELLARECGAVIRTGCAVRRVLAGRDGVKGVETETGEVIHTDRVICNADALYALRSLIPDAGAERVRRVEPSLAGFVIMLGVHHRYPALAHHNVFFSPDYEAEFDALFRRGLPAENPTVYVSASSAVDPTMAPEGHSNLFILVNAPALPAGNGTHDRSWDWKRNAGGYRDRVLDLLEERGLADLRRHVVVERMITPEDFRVRFNAFRGAIYGLSSNTRWSAFLRPSNRVRRIRGLYLVGGSTHPGGGIPLVLLSGRITAGLVMEDAGVA